MNNPITSALLFCLGAEHGSVFNRANDKEYADKLLNSKVAQEFRSLCRVRSAIMLRDRKSTQQKEYPLQEKICPPALFKQTVDNLRPTIGYIRADDFTNQSLYTLYSAINLKLKAMMPELFEEFPDIGQHSHVIQHMLVSKRKIMFSDFLSELILIADIKVSFPWGMYTPMWHRLYKDNKGTMNTVYLSDDVFLPKVYYSAGKFYDISAEQEDMSNYTPEFSTLIKEIKNSRNVAVIMDGDNVPPLYLMMLMKTLSRRPTVKTIKVVYNDASLIQWENINIDKVSYYHSQRYQTAKNNTDMIVAALMMEEQYKGASAIVIVSSDGDYINVIDMIKNSEVLVLLPNATSQHYTNDLEERGITSLNVGDLFTQSYITNTVIQDSRMQAIFMVPEQ